MLCNSSFREKRFGVFMRWRGFLLAGYFLLEILEVGLCCGAVNAGRRFVLSVTRVFSFF